MWDGRFRAVKKFDNGSCNSQVKIQTGRRASGGRVREGVVKTWDKTHYVGSKMRLLSRASEGVAVQLIRKSW